MSDNNTKLEGKALADYPKARFPNHTLATQTTNQGETK